jgi:hypothetical protein
MKLRPGTVVMANEKYPDVRGVGGIGVVVGEPWEGAYSVHDGGGLGVYYDYELDVLHVPIEDGDIVMFESNPEGASVDRVGTVGLATFVGSHGKGCWVQVADFDNGWPIFCLLKRLTVVG